MSESTVYIALGSNLGSRAGNCKKATGLLARIARIEAFSPLYDSAPWGVEEQPRFINGALKLSTELKPEDLLVELKSIESRMGRVESSERRYGPRVIDLDIIFFGERIINIEGLEVPHPLMHERAFVLVPLNDIAPDFIHPVLKRTVRELLANLPPADIEDIKL